jgi:hypothetical protein
MSNLKKKIIFLSPMENGSCHDYSLMKKFFNPAISWFKETFVFLDLGFYGAQKDYLSSHNIIMPHKKPRKSKNNPNPLLTESQKMENKTQARVRVVIEHAIGGIKSFHCLSHRIRNHKDNLIDNMAWLSAGLWNFKLLWNN